MSDKKTITITVSGLNGSGKTTVLRDVMECLANLGYVVGVTTEDVSQHEVLERSKNVQHRARLLLNDRQKNGELDIELRETVIRRDFGQY